MSPSLFLIVTTCNVVSHSKFKKVSLYDYRLFCVRVLAINRLIHFTMFQALGHTIYDQVLFLKHEMLTWTAANTCLERKSRRSDQSMVTINQLIIWQNLDDLVTLLCLSQNDVKTSWKVDHLDLNTRFHLSSKAKLIIVNSSNFLILSNEDEILLTSNEN